MPDFTRRHYEKVAEALRTLALEDRDYTVPAAAALADMFKQDNPKFNRSKFFEAINQEHSLPVVHSSATV